MKRRCPQCWIEKDESAFASPTKRQCKRCVKIYADWSKLSTKQRATRVLRSSHRSTEHSTYRTIFVPKSHNRKLGPIPTTLTDRGTCPPSCSFYEAGCYASYGMLGKHWRSARDKGITWAELLAKIEELPAGTLWRHGTAGDLPGDGDALDVIGLLELLRASWALKGFAFTHKPLRASHERRAVKVCNLAGGFVVNLSADTLQLADDRASLEIGPVVVVLPHDAPVRGLRTPAGRTVVVCPAQTTEGMTCQRCQLCAKPDRKSIVGFRAHGQAAALIPELVKQKRSKCFSKSEASASTGRAV